MEIKLLLLKAIGAAYYSSHTAKPDEEATVSLIDRTLSYLKLSTDITSGESGLLMKLRSLLVYLKGRGVSSKYDLTDLMTRIRVATGDNDRLYDLFYTTLLLVDDPDAAQDKYDDIADELYTYIAGEDFLDLLRQASRTIGFNRPDDLGKYKEELILKLQNLPLSSKKLAAHTFYTLDIGDVQGMTDLFHMAQTAINPDAILKLGFKAANRLRGDQGGGRRGDWCNVSALSGMNKSGDLLDTFIALCIFNKPKLFDPEKIPLHIFVTMEDKLSLVMQKMYALLMQYDTGLPVLIKGVEPSEMAEYVVERLQRNGFKVKFIQFDVGEQWTTYIDILKGYQKEGYEIVSSTVDYVNLFGKKGIPAQVAGDEVQGCHRMIRAFTSPADIYHNTAHQLSTQAKELARMYPEDYIKKLPGKGYYEGCKKLDTEFDFEHYVSKVFHSGETWQEVQWGKHRKLGATNEDDKYYAMKFVNKPGWLGFKYDVELEEGIDYSYKKVGSKSTMGEGGYDFADMD